MQKKLDKNVFCFSDNGIWIGFVKLSLCWREYLPSVVNVLTNSLKILYINKTDIFLLNCLHSDQQIW